MTLVQIRNALVAHLQANWAHPTVPIYYTNTVTMDLDELAKLPDGFLRCEILFDDARQANISDTPSHRNYGTLALTVTAKESEGTVGILGKLDELATAFKFKNLGGIQLQSPRPGWEQSGGGWFSMTLRLSFYADSNT